MDRKTKERIIADLHDKLKDVKFVILTDYSGMNVEKITALRNELRQAKAEFRVVKNTLLRAASNGTGFGMFEDNFKGPIAIVINYGDEEVRPTKTLIDFARKNRELEIKAGILNGKLVSREELSALAELPGRNVLLGKILFLLVSVQTSLVNVLSGVPRSFIQVLEAYNRARG